MVREKRVKDLVIPLTNYPHMPYWGTLKEAIVQLNVVYETGHGTVLVFDEAYEFVGILLQRDILKGLEPKFARHLKEEIPVSWDDLLKSESQTRLTRPVKEFMSGVAATVDAKDSILQASHIMLREDAYLLPVMEGSKVIGIVRMGDLFHEITNAVLKL